MVIRVEAICREGIYELAKDSQSGLWIAEISELKGPKIGTDISHYPVMLRAVDENSNVTVKAALGKIVGGSLILAIEEAELLPLKFILASRNGEELGFVDAEFDVDLGETNDFEMEMKLGTWEQEQCDWGNIIFIPGSEYGGILEDRETSDKKGNVIWKGYTWRGLLSQKIIYPPQGMTHLIVTGEANKIIKDIIGERFGSLFYVTSEDSGLQINNYQFDRYTTVLSGLNKMLETVNAKLHIEYKQGDGGESGAVYISAVPINDWSEELMFNGEDSVKIQTRVYKRGINHLVCAGEGEGTNRLVIHLYVQKDGTIGTTQYYSGLAEREALYSYTSNEDANKLKEDGMKRLKTLMDYKKAEITIDNVDIDIGDIVGGVDLLTGMEIRSPITGKIVKIKNGKVTVDYKVKGEG